ncbi:alginate O-acetylation protein [Ferrigenium kumadai]|uniref:Probable alginate O-acetylase AlgI n=1 Tax=Ferrigenium kumadai TaxID=1682490 RepID=A0AAN1T0R7_9PROT|nr:MBOAT family protein [Ferrigenium kumadai]BBJ00618.1 alginate O-acetylation protein [Ferrigenium kumadai]
MLFNSYAFIFAYLPVVLFGFFWLARINHTFAAGWLALASLFFYGYWNPAYIGLLLGSIVCNYAFGLWIAKAGVRREEVRKKRLLIVAIASNLALLAYYKYANFFVGSVNDVAGTSWGLGEIMLPLGISFFTFTQIAFLVDTYRGEVKEYNFIHYILFVTYFPHLIAGPVLHHKEMMPQFARPSTFLFHSETFALGMTIFLLGLAKKVLIADSLAEFPGPIFSAAEAGGQPMLFEAWIGALSYTLQLYFDFSGYSDMAIGLSLMFNVRLPLNFNSPYKATSIIDFWRRWHMTLSRFLRDYLYIPLGGNRKGKFRRYMNLFATMLLGGLWHGAGWTFVIWGGLHGVYLVINHAWRAFKHRLGLGNGGTPGRLLSIALTFLAVVVAWVFFRAESFTSAISMLSGMLGQNGLSLSESAWRHLNETHPQWLENVAMNGLTPLSKVNPDRALILIILGLMIVWWLPNVQQMLRHYRPALEEAEIAGSRLRWRFNAGFAWASGLIFVLSLSFMSRVRDFLYFQF